MTKLKGEVMSFEEKKIKAFEKSIYSMTPDKNTHEALRGAFDLAWKLARQETLREVLDTKLFAEEFMVCKVPSGAYPDNIDENGCFMPDSTGTNMMSVIEAEQMFKELFSKVLEKLEAEREG